MLNEKPDEFFQWKKKLDELDHLPEGAVTDKTASWDKLHNRLRKKPKNYKLVWYWIAAACLLVAFGLQWIDRNREHDSPATYKKLTTPEQSSQSQELVKENPEINKTVILLKNKNAGTGSSKRKHNQVLINTPVTDKNMANDSGKIKEPAPEIIANTIHSIDSILALAAAPAKKKLRVVHINELGKPLQQEIQFARSISTPAFQSRIFNEDAISGISLGRNVSDNIIKIKLAPSN